MNSPTPPTTIFLVDDSTDVCDRLIEMLAAHAGVETVGVADTAETAIQGILHTRPDCVFLDLRLSEGNGIDVLRTVHGLAPEIVFMVLTNHADAHYRRKCLEAGANFFFDKSHELGRLKDVLAWLALRPRAPSIRTV